MNIIQAIVLGIVQGLTEFIPVSSSGHLVLVPWALGWSNPGLLFDTMLHWGTLAAVLVYFWRDWIDIIRGFFGSLFTRGRWNSAAGGRLADPNARLAWAIIVGTIPAVVVGFLLKDFVESLFDTPTAVGAFMLVTAAILALSERYGRRERPLNRINIPDSIVDRLRPGCGDCARPEPLGRDDFCWARPGLDARIVGPLQLPAGHARDLGRRRPAVVRRLQGNGNGYIVHRRRSCWAP